jgi:hypothetical protein
MRKLFLSLIIMSGAHSLHGMEVYSDCYSKLPPVTLPQAYHYLSEVLNPKIAQYIFSLQQINEDLSCWYCTDETENVVSMNKCIAKILRRHGYLYTVERLKLDLLKKEMSICDIKDNNSCTTLHYIASDYYCNKKIVKLILEVAGDNAWTLLTMQTVVQGSTALHLAAHYNRIEYVKLLLEVAGNQAQAFMNIRNKNGKTAFDIAAPKVQEVMKSHFEK